MAAVLHNDSLDRIRIVHRAIDQNFSWKSGTDHFQSEPFEFFPLEQFIHTAPADIYARQKL